MLDSFRSTSMQLAEKLYTNEFTTSLVATLPRWGGMMDNPYEPRMIDELSDQRTLDLWQPFMDSGVERGCSPSMHLLPEAGDFIELVRPPSREISMAPPRLASPFDVPCLTIVEMYSARGNQSPSGGSGPDDASRAWDSVPVRVRSLASGWWPCPKARSDDQEASAPSRQMITATSNGYCRRRSWRPFSPRFLGNSTPISWG